jgi:serine/threonine protein kinase
MSEVMSHCLDENAALELIDGRMLPGARGAVDRHIESCNACRELVAELARGETQTQPNPLEDGGVDTERTPIGGNRFGPYRVEEAIGQGGAGTVYRGVDERTGRIVALKHVTDPALRARFTREVSTLARLEHDAIVRYIDHGETAAGLYLAMEWLVGETLEERLRGGPLGWQAARVLGMRLASALAHAHAMGCVHRDLSPRNVFLPLGAIERAKLLDFGLVRVQDGELSRTTSQAMLGTPFYMAPEQVKDPKSVDGRADLFGLGVLLFEAISGTRPFDGEDLFTVWVKIVDLPTPDLRRITREPVPPPLIALVEALLAKEPSARPPSADHVQRMLQTLEAPPSYPRPGSVPVPVASTARTDPPSRSSGVWAVGVGLLLLLAVVFFAGGGALLYARSRAAPLGSAPTSTNSAMATGTTAMGEDKIDPEAEASEHYFCGSDTVDRRRGGHYEPQEGFEDVGMAVTAGGACRLTLEDCLIGGKHSVEILGDAQVTLRHCQVKGEVKLVGAVVLTLDGTSLKQAPVIVGKGRVIRQYAPGP